MSNALQKLLGKKSRATTIICAALLAVIIVLGIINFSSIRADISEIGAYLSLAFIRRALLVGCLVALCAALLGVILVLKQYSMIGDGLSHVGFGALTVAMALGSVSADAVPAFVAALFAAIGASPMVFTLVIVIICAVLLLRISRTSSLRGDSAIALISTSSLALGVIITSTTEGMNIDVNSYLFGSILAMTDSDVIMSGILCGAILVLFILFYPRIFSVTFDENFARATGTRAHVYNLLIAALTAVTIVVGMRIMGTMLISSLIIFPALTAMRVCSRFKSVIILSAALSVFCLIIGVLISCLHGLPTGAAIVAVNLVMYLIFALIGQFASRRMPAENKNGGAA